MLEILASAIFVFLFGVSLYTQDIAAFEKFIRSSKQLSNLYFINAAAENQSLLQMISKRFHEDALVKNFDFSKQPHFPFEDLNGFVFQPRVFIFRHFEKISKLEREQVLRQIQEEMQDTCCIFLSLFSANEPFLKQLKNIKAVVLAAAAEKPWESQKRLAMSLQSLAKEHHKQISDVHYFLQRLSFQRELAEQELMKLIIYTKERSVIERADMDALCPEDFSVNVFQLSDAIFQHNLAQALMISERLFSAEQNIFSLLALLRKQFQNAMKILSIDAKDFGKHFAKLSPRALEKNVTQAKMYGFDAAKKALLRINQCDLRARNSKIKSSLLFESLVVELCS